jgi:hypothetical protein
MNENLDIIKKIWNNASNKAKNFGDIPLPKIKISNSKIRLGAFVYPPNSNFYDDFNKSELLISNEVFNKNEKEIKHIVQHEFVHCLIWKEYPSIKQHHPPEFFRIFKNLFGYETRTIEAFKKETNTKNVKKIAMQILASQKHILSDQQLAISCHSLIKRNNGFFASDKQSWFFKKQIEIKGKDHSGLPTLSQDDIGIIASPEQQSGTLSSRWIFVLDPKGVRQKYTEWWKLRPGKTREQVDRMYENMSEREQERNWGLQSEDMAPSWEWGGLKRLWERSNI